MRLVVGLPALKGKLGAYAEQYDMVEVRPVDAPLPSGEKLARWRESVPASFSFSVVLPAAVSELRSDKAAAEALAAAIDAGIQLQASCFVLYTPSSIRPTAANKTRIIALARALPQTGHTLAWHAAGIWTPEEVMATAGESGWLPVFDAAQEPLPPGPTVYTRIRALGHASQLGADRIERIAHQIAGRREAYVVVEGTQGKQVRTELLAALGRIDVQRPIPALFRPRGLSADDEEQ